MSSDLPHVICASLACPDLSDVLIFSHLIPYSLTCSASPGVLAARVREEADRSDHQAERLPASGDEEDLSRSPADQALGKCEGGPTVLERGIQSARLTPRGRFLVFVCVALVVYNHAVTR